MPTARRPLPRTMAGRRPLETQARARPDSRDAARAHRKGACRARGRMTELAEADVPRAIRTSAEARPRKRGRRRRGGNPRRRRRRGRGMRGSGGSPRERDGRTGASRRRTPDGCEARLGAPNAAISTSAGRKRPDPSPVRRALDREVGCHPRESAMSRIDATLGIGGASPGVARRGFPRWVSEVPYQETRSKGWTASAGRHKVGRCRFPTRGDTHGAAEALGSHAGREAKGTRGWQRWVTLPRPRDRTEDRGDRDSSQGHDGGTEPIGC